METPVAAAPAAAPAAPAVVSAPAAPSTPVAAPAPVASPAPASPEIATPTASPEIPKTSEDIIREALEGINADPETPETAAAAAPAAEPAAPAAEPVKTAEEIASEAAAKTAEETPAAETEPEYQPTFDAGEDFGPQNFMERVSGDEGATKFFNEHTDVKNMVCAALRRDVENKEFRKIAPTIEAAREMAGQASARIDFDNRFLAASDPGKVNDFLTSLLTDSLIVDDKGAPVLGEDGKYQVHPALTNTFSHIYQNKVSVAAQNATVTGKLDPALKPVIDGLRAFAEKQGDERLQAAADIISEAIPLSSQGQGEIPEELRPMAANLAREREALDQEKKAAADRQNQERLAKHTESVERVEAKCADSIRSLLDTQAFAKAGLSEFEKGAALQAIGEKADEALGWGPDGEPKPWNELNDAQRLYQATYQDILRRPPTEARDAALRKHILSYTNEIIGPITTAVIRQAKGGQLDRQTAKQSQVAAQASVSKTDPRGASIALPGSQAKDVKTLMAEIRQQSPDMDIGQVMQEALKRQGAKRLG